MTVVPNLVSDFFYGTCNYLISNPAKNRISPVWVGGVSKMLEGAALDGHRANYIRNYSIGSNQILANALLQTTYANAYISKINWSPDF